MRNIFLTLFPALTLSVGAVAEPSADQIALATELAGLMKYEATYAALVKQCIHSAQASIDPKAIFSGNPASFGGISPQSALWPDVEAIYQLYRVEVCSTFSPARFTAYVVQQYTSLSTEELRATVAFYSSPSGRRFQSANVSLSESFSTGAYAEALATSKAAGARLTQRLTDLATLYQAQPR